MKFSFFFLISIILGFGLVGCYPSSSSSGSSQKPSPSSSSSGSSQKPSPSPSPSGSSPKPSPSPSPSRANPRGGGWYDD